MGEMPRLSNTDPWQLMQAFAQQYGRDAYRQQRQLARNDKMQDAVQDAQGYDSPSTPTDTSTPSPDELPPTMARPLPDPVTPQNVKPLIADAAQGAGVSLPLFTRLVQAESNFKQSARSPTGATGLAQLMPGTAKMMGVNPNDPADNLRGGAKYLAQQVHHFGDDGRALAAYNWGPGNVDKWIKRGADPSKAPVETQNYVRKITGKPLAMNDTPAPPDAPEATPDDPDKVDPTTRLSWLA